MARDYRNLLASDGIWIPRWLAVMAAMVVAGWVGYRVYAPPIWMVQRLDAPNSERAARLMRTTHQRDHLMVQIKEGWLWQTYHVSDPIETDHRLDLEERLRWSDDSSRIYLRVMGKPVWGYDFTTGRTLSADDLDEVRN